MTNKYILSGTALFAVVALVFAIDAAFAVPEITEAELQDVLGNKIHDPRTHQRSSCQTKIQRGGQGIDCVQ